MVENRAIWHVSTAARALLTSTAGHRIPAASPMSTIHSEEQLMRLNQVTVSMPDLDEGWRFYRALGLTPIVDSRPHYARFRCPDGDSTFSIAQGEGGCAGTHV